MITLAKHKEQQQQQLQATEVPGKDETTQEETGKTEQSSQSAVSAEEREAEGEAMDTAPQEVSISDGGLLDEGRDGLIILLFSLSLFLSPPLHRSKIPAFV